MVCFPIAGLSVHASDCDDTNPAIHPGAMVCGPQGTVLVRGIGGTYTILNCGQQGICVPQPNGTGICVP